MVRITSRPSRFHHQSPYNNNKWKVAKYQLLISFIICSVCFYGGTLTGMHTAVGGLMNSDCGGGNNNLGRSVGGGGGVDRKEKMQRMIQERVYEELEKEKQNRKQNQQKPLTASNNNNNKEWVNDSNKKFKSTTKNFLTAAARTPKESFMSTFDMGLPIDAIPQGGSDVLLLYQTDKSIPSDESIHQAAVYNAPEGLPLVQDANLATSNCGTMNVILTDTPQFNSKQCTAIVGNYESYHIQRWMRVPEERTKENKGQLDSSLPLRNVGRGYQGNGVNNLKVPMEKAIKYHWGMLGALLSSYNEAMDTLRPIVERIAKNRVVIVQTVNFGQVELLINFVCSAKSRGLDVSNVLVFATDEESRDVAMGLGLEVFYDEKIYGDIPSEEAQNYGDRKFAGMMYAKVVCVQLILMLGYDVLFQDVDIVWYQDPLSFLQNPSMMSQNFDIYFQDDGSRQVRYAPYSANSGFYYVRQNERTTYLFTALLYAGDAIKATGSHQQVLVGLLAEHSSLFGLRVKILGKYDDEFPGGYHYHMDRAFMKSFVKGETNTLLFHMSWTKNKDNKLKFFQQMGDWFVQDQCIGKKAGKILGGGESVESGSLLGSCCAAEATITCHYKDKPSKIPCKDSPPIDSNGPTFW